MPKTHILKCVNPYFQELENGNKTFELRKADRNYQLGDVLILKEYFPDNNIYSGREHSLSVDYIRWYHRGLNINYIVMAERERDFDIYPSDSLKYAEDGKIKDSTFNIREISYVLNHFDFPDGLNEGFCIISYKPLFSN